MKTFITILTKAIFFAPSLILSSFGIRFVVINHPDRIGHLCVEPDCFIKEGALGMRPRYFGVALIPRYSAANQALLALWSRQLTVVTSTVWYRMLRPFLNFSRTRYDTHQYAVAIDSTAHCATIYAKWADRPPLLRMSEMDQRRGLDCLEKMGLPANAWFICVHSRDGAYSPGDEHLHSYRNSDIETYILAMKAITERGGWCIRVGERSSKPLPQFDGVIDYANSPFKSDSMDVFLCANCRFFLGNSSGLYLLASIFGVHTALANLIPVSASLPVSRGDLGIHKILRSRKTGQLLNYREILGSPVGNFRFTSQYEGHGILLEDNSAEDIRDLAVEMLTRINSTVEYSEYDEELQNKVQRLMKPGHYSYGADSRIGRDFLRKYSEII